MAYVMHLLPLQNITPQVQLDSAFSPWALLEGLDFRVWAFMDLEDEAWDGLFAALSPKKGFFFRKDTASGFVTVHTMEVAHAKSLFLTQAASYIAGKGTGAQAT
ncbi:MAG: hypothetical protein N2561_07425 [Bacteroidetes bacterium]|nr:hypothetical protein [Bacteroidota bacterium]